MNKIIVRISLAITAIFTLSACSNDDIDNNSVKNASVIISALTPGELTRTAIDASDQTKVNWISTDALSLFDNASHNDKYDITGGTGTTSATFECSAPSANPTAALYPYFSQAKFDGTQIYCYVPSSQKAVKNSFDPAAGIMVGTVDGTTIKFHHAVAYLKVKAPNDVTNLLAITIEAVYGKNLTGVVSFSPTDGSLSSIISPLHFVTLSGPFEAGADYYAAIIPGAQYGLRIRYLYGKDEISHTAIEKQKTKYSSFTMEPGHIKAVGAPTSFDETNKAAVQLWKDGPYFATRNVCMSDAWGNDKFFAWGAQYLTDLPYNGIDYENGALKINNDTAYRTWGSSWRMPTVDEMQGLINNCDCKFISGSWGFKFTGKDDYSSNSIILPAVEGASLYAANATYWTSTANGDEKANALILKYEGTSDIIKDFVSNDRSSEHLIRAILR